MAIEDGAHRAIVDSTLIFLFSVITFVEHVIEPLAVRNSFEFPIQLARGLTALEELKLAFRRNAAIREVEEPSIEVRLENVSYVIHRKYSLFPTRQIS